MAVLVISYARVDQRQVRAIVALLKAALRDVERAVFWDGELEPGDPWFEQIKRHIDKAPQLFVFWCEHSAASKQVRREFEYAIQVQKRVVPVLLDDTKLCDELAPIAGIDLRGSVIHTRTVEFTHGTLHRPIYGTGDAPTVVLRQPPKIKTEKTTRSHFSGSALAAITGLGTIVSVVSYLWLVKGSLPWAPLSHFLFTYWWPLALVLIPILIGAVRAWFGRKREVLEDRPHVPVLHKTKPMSEAQRRELQRRFQDHLRSERPFPSPPRPLRPRAPVFIEPSVRPKIVEQFAAQIRRSAV